MKVMLMMWSDGSYPGDSEGDFEAWSDFESGLRADGVYAAAGQFHAPEAGRVVVTRLSGGDAVEPGPVTGSGGSVLAGYYLLDCESLDAAAEYARRAPLYGSVEIRQLVDF